LFCGVREAALCPPQPAIRNAAQSAKPTRLVGYASRGAAGWCVDDAEFFG
jgi:hypothetical protein